MRNLSIHLLHAIVSFTPSCVPLFLRPMCIDEIRFILCPCFLFSIYLSPPPRYKRASAVCDISTPVNWQESHLLFRFVAPFWLLLVYKYVEGGYSKFFFLVGPPQRLCLFELDKEDCRLDTTIVYILAELWVCVIGWRRSRRPHRLLSCLVSKMCQVFMWWRESWGEQLLETPSFFFHHQYGLCR